MRARLNSFPSKSKNASRLPAIVLIPGGGGFSGSSWGSPESLQRTFDVVTVDPPGTGGLERHPSYTYDGIISSIEKELATLKRPLVLAGISFGCVYAADLATRGEYEVVGYVGLCGMVSPSAFQALSEPNPYLSNDMQEAENEFMKNPSDTTWQIMLERLVPIYFSPAFHEKGRKLLLEDKSEYKSYLEACLPYVKGESGNGVVDRIKKFKEVKILAAAENDRLIFPSPVEKDASEIGATFERIAGGSHFVFFEQPEATTRLFEKYFLYNK